MVRIDKLAGEAPTTENIAAAANTLQDFNGDGMMQPVTFPEMHESMAPCMGFGQVQSGAWKLTAGTARQSVPLRDADRRHRLTMTVGTASGRRSVAGGGPRVHGASNARRGTSRLSYIYPGIVIGALYALLGGSLTLTYSLTGVINLAVGAMAYASAYLFYHLVYDRRLAAVDGRAHLRGGVDRASASSSGC